MTEVFRLTASGKNKDYSMAEDNLTLAQMERFQILEYIKTNGPATADQIIKFTKLPAAEVLPIMQDFKKSGLVEPSISK